MALKIMDLFKSIKWAKNGDVTDMSQTNYEAGWSHLGDDTPTVEDFNIVQQLNDEKDQWLFNQIKAVCDAKGIAITETDKQALLKAINISATLSRAGIVQLSNAIDSTINNMAATPKAIKTLKDLIDAITRNLGNYIPNSKKSNAVNSNSADTVATSVAVKAAYDLADAAYKVDTNNQNQNLNNLLGQNTVFGTSGRAAGTTGLGDIYNYGVGLAVSASGARAMLYIPHSHAGSNNGVWVQSNFSTNNAAPHWRRIDGADFADIRGNPFTVAGYKISSTTGYISVQASNAGYAGLEVERNGTSGNWQSRFEALPDRRWKFWTNSDSRGFEQYLPAKSGTIALMDDVNGRVSKSGDTMTGQLNIKNGEYSAVRTYNTAGWSARWESAQNSEAHFAAIVQANNNESAVNRVLIPKKTGTVALMDDVNGRVSKSGDEMRGDLSIRSGDWSGLNLYNLTGKYFRIETNPDHASHFGSFIYRNATGANEAVIYMPKRNGEIALKGDVAVLTGEIGHGGVIPLPAGFDEHECRWIVTPKYMRDDVTSHDIQYFECHAQGTRTVTCLVEGKVSKASKASYIIVGVKQ